MTFDQILTFIQSQNEFIIYGIIIFASFVENVFPPFPGDSVTIAGAIVAGGGNISYIGVLLSATSGGVAGAMFLYYLGRAKGRPYFAHSRFFGQNALIRVESLFTRFGDIIIMLSRFIIGIRSAVSVAAGVGNVQPFRMTALTAASFVLWNWLLLGLVFYTKYNWRTIAEISRKYQYAIIILLAIAAVIILVRWIWKKAN